MTTVLDANALMMPVECDLRLFDELERLGATDPVVPRAVVDELESLAEGTGEEARAARVGLDLVDRCEIRDTDADYADDAVVELATGGGSHANDDSHADDNSDANDDSEVDYAVTNDDSEVDYAVTNDRPLRDRLLAESVSVIGLRGGTKLAINQP